MADVRAGRLPPRDAEDRWRSAGIPLPFPAARTGRFTGDQWRPSEAVAFIACRSRREAEAQSVRLNFWDVRLLREEREPDWRLSLADARLELLSALRRGALKANGLRSMERMPHDIPASDWRVLDFSFAQESAIHNGYRELVAPEWFEVFFPAAAIESLLPSAATSASGQDREEDQQHLKTGRPVEDALVEALLDLYGTTRPLRVKETAMRDAAYERLQLPPPSRSSALRRAIARAWPLGQLQRRRPPRANGVQ